MIHEIRPAAKLSPIPIFDLQVRPSAKASPIPIFDLPDEVVDRITTFCNVGAVRPTCSQLALLPSMRCRALSALQKALETSRVRGHCYAHYAVLTLRRRMASMSSMSQSIAGLSFPQGMPWALVVPLAWLTICSSFGVSWIHLFLRCLLGGLIGMLWYLRETREMHLLIALLEYQRQPCDDRMLRVIGLLIWLPIVTVSGSAAALEAAKVHELTVLRPGSSDGHGQYVLGAAGNLNDVDPPVIGEFDVFLSTRTSWFLSDTLVWRIASESPGGLYHELRQILDTAVAGRGPPELTSVFRWLQWRVGRLACPSCRTVPARQRRSASGKTETNFSSDRCTIKCCAPKNETRISR